MALVALRKDGWFVDALRLRENLGDEYNEAANSNELSKILIDIDIKQFGEAVMNEKLDKSSLKGPIVVQLSKWENISYPKIHDHSKNDGVCVMMLTDGHKTVKAMTEEPLSKISGDTPYGTKISLTGTLKVENGIVQLTNKNCRYVGGQVEKLVEKWKSEKYSSKSERGVTAAPKWLAFGKRGRPMTQGKDDFKAMAAANGGDIKPKETNTEFEVARQAEIAQLKEARKNASVPTVKLPESLKKPANEKPPEPKPFAAAPPTRFEERKETTFGDRDRTSGRGGRRGRVSDNTVDIRTYVSKPEPAATVFDLIKAQMKNPPLESSAPVQTYDQPYHLNSNNYQRKPENRQRGNYQRQQPPRSSDYNPYAQHDTFEAFQRMDISSAPSDSYYGGASYPPNHDDRGGRGGGRGRGGMRSFQNSNFRGRGKSSGGQPREGGGSQSNRGGSGSAGRPSRPRGRGRGGSRGGQA